MRILVVEDEAPLLQQLTARLRQEGYAVDAASNGEAGLYLAQEYPVDLAIVDIGLPKLTGIEVIRHVRSRDKSFPIIILTARGRWQEKVEGLEAGADDYMVKPFHMEELLARVRALLRRSAGYAQSVLRCGPISLNTATQEVQAEGRTIELTAYEYKVLEYLMLHPRQVVSKAALSEHIYEEDEDRDSNVIEVFVGRLRRKLDPNNAYMPIETLRGRGYRFTLEPAPD